MFCYHDRATTAKYETASRDMEADRKNRLAKETEFGQLQRDNALLQHKLSDSQRRADLEADKRKKVDDIYLLLCYTSCLFRFVSVFIITVASKVVTDMVFSQMETDIINLSRQIDDLKSSNNKKVDAASREDKLRIEELQRKLKSETDAVAKLHKSLKDQKKVNSLYVSKRTSLTFIQYTLVIFRVI